MSDRPPDLGRIFFLGRDDRGHQVVRASGQFSSSKEKWGFAGLLDTQTASRRVASSRIKAIQRELRQPPPSTAEKAKALLKSLGPAGSGDLLVGVFAWGSVGTLNVASVSAWHAIIFEDGEEPTLRPPTDEPDHAPLKPGSILVFLEDERSPIAELLTRLQDTVGMEGVEDWLLSRTRTLFPEASGGWGGAPSQKPARHLTILSVLSVLLLLTLLALDGMSLVKEQALFSEGTASGTVAECPPQPEQVPFAVAQGDPDLLLLLRVFEPHEGLQGQLQQVLPGALRRTVETPGTTLVSEIARDQGVAVGLAQLAMQAQGVTLASVDGVFGTATKEKYREFSQHNAQSPLRNVLCLPNPTASSDAGTFNEFCPRQISPSEREEAITEVLRLLQLLDAGAADLGGTP